MLLRLVFIAALIAMAIWFWRRWQRSGASPRNAQLESAPMVRCAHCNTHIPQDTAIAQEALWYCSQQHQLLGPKSR